MVFGVLGVRWTGVTPVIVLEDACDDDSDGDLKVPVDI